METNVRDTKDVEGARLIDARIDNLPMTRHIWTLVLMLALGAFFEAYEISLTALLSPGLVRAGVFASANGVFGLPDQAAFASATFLGMFVGALTLGRFADRLGRKRAFTASLLTYTAATLAMAFQESAAAIDLCRLAAGVGLGAELVVIDAYLAELVPPRFRGRAFALAAAIQFLAVPVAGGLCLALIPHRPFGFEGWRWVCVIGSLGALLVMLTRTRLPESPRWLAQRGNLRRADEIVTALERKCFGSAGAPTPALTAHRVAVEVDPSDETAHRASLFAPVWRRRVVMLTTANVLIAIGFFGFGSWLPTLLASQGHSIVKSLQFTLCIALCYPLCPLVFMLFADRVERKWQISGATLLAGVLGVCFGYQDSSLRLVLFGTAVTMANLLTGYALHTYQSELFPSAIRARAVGFVYSWSRLAVVFSSLVIGSLLQTGGANAVLLFLGATQVAVAVLVAIMGPRTLAIRDVLAPA